MAINQNRNSIRVLRTTGVGYLAHKNIPNFSVGGGADFTIQLWVMKSRSLDGLLYGQEGGFSIRLVGGRVMFSLPGCVTLTVEDSWTLPVNRHDYIAIRCSGGKYTAFINGIPAAEKTVAAKAAKCTGEYYIGKNFIGGFSLIRVSNNARSDSEILKDNAVYPKADVHCVFQSDCSTAKYKDVSANNLPLWAVGTGAGCGIFTACTSFSGKGQIGCSPAEPLPTTHTLLLKLWPMDVNQRQQVYAAMDGSKAIYTLELLPQENSTFKLSFTNSNGAQVISSAQLMPQCWQDVAAVFEGGKLTLYVDGKREGVYSLAISGNRSTLIVGSEYESGKPYYERGFFGYMAYTAEFGRAVPADEIALYADDPPFMFEDGLVSLLPLDWPNEVESVGATALWVAGSAPFTMVEDITPRDGDIGVSVRMPTKISPEWEKLSEDKKWAYNLLDKLNYLVAIMLHGHDLAKFLNMSKSVTKILKYHNGKLYEKLIDIDAIPSQAEMTDLGVELYGQSGKLAVAAGGAETATAAVTGVGEGGQIAIATVASAFGAELVAAVTGEIIESEKKRKKSNGQLKIAAVTWNHLGEPTIGGIHYHVGSASLPESMTDKDIPSEDRLKSRCVLVLSKLTDLRLDVTLKLSGETTRAKSGTLRVQTLNTVGGYGPGDASANYNISPGGSTTVYMCFHNTRFPRNGLHKISVVLQFRDGDNFLTNCDCDIYTLPGLPITPWVVGNGTNYSTGEAGYLRLEFADLFLQNDDRPEDFASVAVKCLNESGFVYDTDVGNCNYSDPNEKILKLDNFIRDLNDINRNKADHRLNCSDCAHIVCTACAMVGIELPMAIFMGYNNAVRFFKCNQIIPIGLNEWQHPFVNRGGGFSYHMFNAITRKNGETTVYDACLKVDRGNYPGLDGSNKIACLPVDMPARETLYDVVDVPTNTAYTKNYYRERLVRNGTVCNFLPGYYERVVGFSVKRAVSKLTPDAYVLHVMKDFDLSPTSEEREATKALSRREWRLRNIPGITVENEAERYDSGSVAAPRCLIEHWSFATADEAAVHLGATVAYYATPSKYLGQQVGVDVGERCVVISDRYIFFCRLGHVFSIKAASLSDALSVARTLDNSVNAQ